MSGFAIAESATRVALIKRRQNVIPFMWAHRGESERAPENSLSSWRRAFIDGYGAESDWRLSSDGTFFSMHDATIDRTCTTAGTVSALSAATLAATDNGTKYNSVGYAAERVPTLAQALDQLRQYNGWQLFENSNQVQADAISMANQMVAKGVQDRCVLAQFGGPPYTVLAAVRAAFPLLKTQVLVLTAAAAPVPATLAAAGATYVTPDISDAYVDAAWVASCQAAGVKVMPYTVDTLALRNKAVGLGLDGWITGRPALMQRGLGAGYPLTELWRDATNFMWGDDWLFDNANYVGSPNYPRPFDGVCGTTSTAVLLGGAVCIGRPLPAATESYQLEFSVILKTVNGDATRYAAMQFALQQDTMEKVFAPCAVNGYGLVFRQNGTFSIDKYVAGNASVALVSDATSAALVVDQATPFRLTVTPTQLTLRRLDNAKQVTVADATFRAGKAGLIWSNGAMHFGPIIGTSL